MMDPDELLRKLLEISKLGLEANGLEGDDVMELVEGVQNLDQWLEKGGFLPARWEKNRERPR